MSNPFSSIITSTLKGLHKNMIDALLEDTALTRKCTLNYDGTKFTTCENCTYNVIGGKSGNRYRSGGPIPFSQGVCPMCGGSGKISESESSTLFLMCIFDSKKFYYSNPNLKTADINLQTMSKISTYSEVRRCSYLELTDSNTQGNINLKFIRAGEPEFIGWGNNDYIITSWKRA